MGHDVKYDLPDGKAARVGPVTVGIPGIALWWDRWFRKLDGNAEKYDLIWTHQPLTPRLPSRNPKIWNRMIVTFHTTEYAKYGLTREGIYPRTRQPYHWVTRRIERHFYQNITGRKELSPQFTVVSPQIKDEIAAFGVTDAAYVPNGVFVPEDRSFEPIRTEYNIPEDATLVFNIGSLSAQKRPVLFAETMATVCEQREDLYCVMAGKGPKGDTVAKYTSDRLKAVGYVSEEEKWRWFADADIFASLSAYEGMPVATLEALSFGLPVVLSDISAHRAVVEEHNATGVCVHPEWNTVATAIKKYEDSEAVVSLPPWSDIAASYIDLVR